MRVFPGRVVVDTHGHYWRDYGDFYSMPPVSDENTETVVAIAYIHEDDVQAKVAEAVAAERARIRAAVEGLRTDWGQRITSMGPETVSVSMVDAVDRAAVLAAINGIPPTTITDLPDIGTGYPEEADHA